MKIKNPQNISYLILYSSVIIILGLFFQPFPVHADHDVLIELITEYNLKEIENSLVKDTYRGEAGILRIKPEVAESLGLKAYIDDDYRASSELFGRAEKNLDLAMKALRSEKKNEDELIAQVVDHFLLYKTEKEAARLKMAAYHSRLKPDQDERLNESLCRRQMEELLNKSLARTDSQLRDALALFYNLCRGDDSDKHHLSVDNVRFVNFVYRNFLDKAPADEKERFGLDRQLNSGGAAEGKWKEVAAAICPQYIDIFERIIPRYGKEIYEIDPLLFMALIKRESNFNPLAISSVGAAGLTQIMPGTAAGLGMKDIHQPEYYREAGTLLRQEREAREAARATLFLINEENGMKAAGQARELMKKSLSVGKERERLFNRYKVDLLRLNNDTRLDPEQSLEHGLIYFLRQMRARDGDISLALASYNAGPHRVKEYQGIPPFDETVRFRNMVLRYYREYTEKAQANRTTVKSAWTD